MELCYIASCSVAKIVKTVIHAAIRDEMLYPKKVFIPLLDSPEVVDASMHPKGQGLLIHVHGIIPSMSIIF